MNKGICNWKERVPEEWHDDFRKLIKGEEVDNPEFLKLIADETSNVSIIADEVMTEKMDKMFSKIRTIIGEEALEQMAEQQQRRQEDKVYESIIVVAFIAAMIALIILSNI